MIVSGYSTTLAHTGGGTAHDVYHLVASALVLLVGFWLMRRFRRRKRNRFLRDGDR
jgi:hypothetical protein